MSAEGAALLTPGIVKPCESSGKAGGLSHYIRFASRAEQVITGDAG